MHELSLATALVEQLRRVCAEQKATAVASVRLRVGALAGVDRESFAFVFPIVAEGTCAEKAGLVFDEVPAEVTCDACGRRWHPERMLMHCESCQSTRVRVTGGREFDLVSVEVSTGEESEVRSQESEVRSQNARPGEDIRRFGGLAEGPPI